MFILFTIQIGPTTSSNYVNGKPGGGPTLNGGTPALKDSAEGNNDESVVGAATQRKRMTKEEVQVANLKKKTRRRTRRLD